MQTQISSFQFGEARFYVELALDRNWSARRLDEVTWSILRATTKSGEQE